MKRTLLLAAVLGARLSAQVLNVDRLYQRPEFQDAQGAAVVEPIFRPGEKNILIIHGFNSQPADMQGLTEFLTAQCANVMLYKYPSGISPALSGRYLYQALSDVVEPGIRFDMVGYSEGGLVARVAKEPGPLNGGRAFGDRVGNLVTIGTPHEGLPQVIRGRDLLVILGLAAPVQAITEMLGGSEFLRMLNTNPQQGATQYFTVAGNLFATDDGLVFVDSGLGKNVLRTAGQAIVGLGHSEALAAGRAMPNHADVYSQTKLWIVDGAPPPSACAFLGGNWTYRENATERCVIGGQAEKPERLSASGTVPVTQEPGTCTFRYDVQDLVSQGPRLTRTGVTDGVNVTVTGVAAAVLAGSGVTLTENSFRATGKLCGQKVNLTGQASFAGAVNGIPLSCVYDTTVDLARAPATQTGRFTSLPGASFSGAMLSPESIASGFGSALSTGTQAATTVPLPTTLAGTRVRVTDSTGAGRDAALFFASPGQINYLVPAGTAPGLARVEVLRGAQTAAQGTALILPVAPGLFSANASGDGVAAAVVERITASGVRSSQPAFQFDNALRKSVATPINLGAESDQVFVVLYGTGIRGINAASRVIVTIDGEPVPVLYAGAQPNFAGLDQVNVGPLPRKLLGRGVVPVVLDIDGRLSNIVTLTFGAVLGIPAFRPAQSFNFFPAAMAIGDANGDGVTDIVAGNPTGQVFLIAGTADGVFRTPAMIFRTSTANGIAIGDYNRDGRPDLIVISAGTDSLQYLAGTADGGFGPPQRIMVGPRLRGLYVRDLNGDGIPDVITTSEVNINVRGDDIAVMLGNGDGTFRAAQILNGGPGSQPFPLEFVDTNGDGALDIVAQNQARRELMIFRGDRNGAFQAAQSVPIGATGPLGGFAVADVDGDGLPDLIAAHGSTNVAVALNTKAGSFQAPRNIVVANRGQLGRVATGDFNRDGVMDFVVSHNGTTGVSVVFGNRQGAFPAAKLLTTSERPVSLFAVDLNRDGNLDVISSRELLLGLGNGEFVPTQNLPSGQLLDVRDLNSDGAADLIWGADTAFGGSFSVQLQR